MNSGNGSKLGALALGTAALLAAACGARGSGTFDGPIGGGAAKAAFAVTGKVKTPTAFSLDDLRRLDAVSARAAEVRRGGEFLGSYTVRGAPLRSLLDAAVVDKGASAFDKKLDLAVVVTGASGRRAALSWGELYYRNPAEVIVAYDSQPVIPHKPCERCHGPEVFGARLEILKRALVFPKLVATRDLWGDRSVEGIAAIEVVEPLPGDPATAPKKNEGHERLRAESATIVVPGQGDVVVSSLDGYPRVEVDAIMVGDGIGFHGTRRYAGAPLADVLTKAGIAPGPATALLLSAPDGYRVLLSASEVFDAPNGPTAILADSEGGTPLDDGGRFQLILPGDHAADRWLKSVSRIEVVKF